MTQIQRKKKMTGQFWKNKTLQKISFTAVLTIAREMAKTKDKNTDEICELIFLKIYPQQQNWECQTYSNYIYWESQTIYSASYLKLHTNQLLHLFVDMYFKVFLKTIHDFARLIFAFNKFQEVGTKSLFLSFQISLSASYFPISQAPLDQNSSMTSL